MSCEITAQPQPDAPAPSPTTILPANRYGRALPRPGRTAPRERRVAGCGEAGRVLDWPGRDYCYFEVNRALRQAHPQVVAEIIAGVVRHGGSAVQDLDTDLVRVNGEFTVSIVLARCTATAGGSLRWRIRLDTGLVPDITIAVRMDKVNEAPRDYYVLPGIGMTFGKLKFAEQNGLALDAYRFDTLDVFYALAARARIAEVA